LKVLLAVNHPQLVDQFCRESNFEVTPSSDVCYRDAVIDAISMDQPDILVLSAFLDGKVSFFDVVFAARKNNVRVVFLAGSLEEDDPLLGEIASLGVYDIIFNPATLTKIVTHIKEPAQFSDIAAFIKNKSVNGKSLTSKRLPDSNKSSAGNDISDNKNGDRFGVVSKLKAMVNRKPPEEEMEEKPEDTVRQPIKAESETGIDNNNDSKDDKKNSKVVIEGKEKILKSNEQYYQPSLIEQRSNYGTAERINRDIIDSRKISIACWSPVPAGKTFVAVNLAVFASMNGEKAALLDLDFHERAIYTWLNISSNPTGIFDLLSGNPAEPARHDELTVYGADPLGEPLLVSPEIALNELLRHIPSCNFIVLDMPREITGWHWEIMRNCDHVVVIADPDCGSYLKITRHVERLKEAKLVINKDVDLRFPLGYEDLLGVKPVVKIPLAKEIYNSILLGAPLVSTDSDIKQLFNVLYQKLKQQ
jgi:Mrp family chromosome partitioning ATPase